MWRRESLCYLHTVAASAGSLKLGSKLKIHVFDKTLSYDLDMTALKAS